MAFASIPAGEFLMGSGKTEDGHSSDETQHRVRFVDDILMGVHPVTQAQWQGVMGNNPSIFKGMNRPVENISWHDALAFCQKLGEMERKRYRLPTEAEWEYACRAGTTTPYYTGIGKPALGEAGWYSGNSGAETHSVGDKRPNAWGLYDMHGNVWELCSDWYDEYPMVDAVNPQGQR
jgi:formylglycine-generating enzyme required for sulfatase activity